MTWGDNGAAPCCQRERTHNRAIIAQTAQEVQDA